ncbi:MAG: tyrosine--tRNA ligase [Leptospiraceae bacterium]|nr:tyrosine--tRNA ligase [Leptospiraceae bacterium]MDW8307524.1 tyrosine--tRNA ligase [Leptospiraceae bacterium]
MVLSAEEQFQELKRGCLEIIPEEAFLQKLKESVRTKTPLRVKAGFDPTAPDLHLGHSVLLQKMRQFQDMGHEVYFLIGDYTAMIGDPTGKSQTRKPLTREEVEQNARTYEKQVGKVLNLKRTRIVFNSTWLERLSLKDVIRLTANYTVARLLERDDFSQRYRMGQSISLVEFLYPLLQGYDSVALQADIELGGSDQKFNLLVGRDMQLAYGQSPQCIMTLPLLVGLDGQKKMSKSLGNYVALEDEAIEMYGKLMSISDELMWEYYLLLSSLSLREIEERRLQVREGKLHPKEAKSELAFELTSRFHGKERAQEARDEWEKIHTPQKRGLPDDMPQFEVALEGKSGLPLLEIVRLCGFASSNSEARRLMEQGGLHLIHERGEETLTQPKALLGRGEYVFRAGKRRFAKLRIL